MQSPASLAWWGALIATAPMLLFVAYIAVSKKGRTLGRFSQGLGIAIVGLVLSLIFYSQLLPVLYAGLLGVLGLFLYDNWYTPFSRDNHTELAVGKQLPKFALKNLQGELEQSISWQGTPFFLIFIRGNWCPLCVAQISELAAIYQQIEERGVAIKVVAAQKEKDTQKLAARFDVPMQFYVDENNAATKQLKLLHKDGVGAGMLGYDADTFYPTVMLVNAEQEIVYIDLTDNYRVRPEPQILLDATMQYL